MRMPSPSAAERARCSLPTPNVVDVSGIFLFMPDAAHWRKNEMRAPPTSAATTKFGAASWILAMVEPKSETSSGKKLVARMLPLLLDVVRHPFGGDLAVVVVGGQHVDLV